MGGKKNSYGSHDRDERDDHHGHGQDERGIKLAGTRNDDVLTGTDRNDKLSGGNGNDKLYGLAGNDKLDGGNGNDKLDGGAGNDLLIGGRGDDSLQGGGGDDVLYGDGKGKGWAWGWDKCVWWNPHSEYDDILDGGAGNDKVYGGRGDDVLLYSMAGNLGAGFADIGTHDFYDGGSGFDTLRLSLTYGEFDLASVKEDIAAFNAFLEDQGKPHRGHDKTFEFKSFDLVVRDIEKLEYVLVNTAPTANADSAATDEDTPLTIAASLLLGNDADPDHLDVISVTGADATSARGAVVQVAADGSVSYDPTNAHALQQLAQGMTAVDTFHYTIADLAGATATGFVEVTVTGVNDAPESAADSNATDEDHAALGNVLANDTDIDLGDMLHVAMVNGTAANVGVPIELASGALLTVNANGSYSYDPNGHFEHLGVGASAGDSFTYVAADLLDAHSEVTTVSLTIAGVNDNPVAADDAKTGDEDRPFGGSVLANDTDVDLGDTLHVATINGSAANVGAAFALASGALLTVNADGTFTYDPNGKFEYLAVGESAEETFTYVAADNYDGPSNTATVTVTVEGVNDTPDAVNDVVAPTGGGGTPIETLIDFENVLSSGEPFTLGEYTFIGFSTDATFGNGSWGASASEGNNSIGTEAPFADAAFQRQGGAEFALVSLQIAMFGGTAPVTILGYRDGAPVAGASEEVPASGTFSDEPFGPAWSSIDEVRFFADSFGVTILLDNVVVATGGGAAAAGFSEDQAFDITDLLDNDTDPDLSDVLAVDSAGPLSAMGASISLNPDGTLHYDPTLAADIQALAEGETATDTFSYTVTDGHGGFDSATVSVSLLGVNDGPVATNDAASTNKETAFSGNVLGNDFDVDGDALAVTAGSFTSTKGASVTIGANGIYSYDPTTSATLQALGAGASTVDTFGYTVSDGNGGTDTATVSVTVSGLAEPGSGGGNFPGPSVSANVNFKDLLPVVASSSDVDLYIRFDGVSPEWLELGSFSMSLERPVDAGSGQVTGKVQLEDVLAALGSSEMVVKLTQELFEGKDLDAVQIGMYAPSKTGQMALVDAFRFDGVHLTGLDTSGSTGNTVNDLSFGFSGFSHKSVELGGSSYKEGSWDFSTEGHPVGSPEAPTTAPTKDLGEGLPTDAQIEYYVHFHGSSSSTFSNEWLRLESFSMGLHAPQSQGQQSGPVQAEALGLELGANTNLVPLTNALDTNGDVDVEIEAYAISSKVGTKQLVDQYYFDNARVTGLDTADGNANTLELTYQAFSHGHVGDGVSQFGWEFSEEAGGGNFPGPSVSANVNFKDLLPVVASSSDVDLYIRFDGVSPEWLELGSFSMSLERPVDAGSGQVTGKVQLEDVLAALGSSEMVVKLTQELFEGKDLDAVQIGMYAPSKTGQMALVDAFRFDGVHLTGLDTSGSTGNTVNDLSFGFSGFSHKSVELGGSSYKEGSWDFSTEGHPVGSPEAPTTAPTKDLGEGLPTDAQIEYYVHFHGSSSSTFSNEWLRLESFSMGLHAPQSQGQQSGPVQAEALGLELGANTNLVPLTNALDTNGDVDVEIEAYAISSKVGTKQLVDQYYFDNARVTGLDTADGNANTLELTYQAFSHGHVGDGVSQFGWEFDSLLV
jgi:VCBS repeat-containing protein